MNRIKEPTQVKIIGNFPKPHIYMTPEAYIKMMAYADTCEYEVGWLCHVTNNDRDFIIDECFLPEQTVSGTTCEFSEQGISDVMTEIITNYSIDYWNNITCWCHSHVNMPPRPSGQDNKQIMQWKDRSYFIMIIINKQGEFYAEFYNFKDKVAFNNLSVELYHPDKDKFYKDAAREVKDKVKTLSRVYKGNNFTDMRSTPLKYSYQYPNVLPNNTPKNDQVSIYDCLDNDDDDDDDEFIEDSNLIMVDFPNPTSPDYHLFCIAEKFIRTAAYYCDEYDINVIRQYLVGDNKQNNLPNTAAESQLFKDVYEYGDKIYDKLFSGINNSLALKSISDCKEIIKDMVICPFDGDESFIYVPEEFNDMCESNCGTLGLPYTQENRSWCALIFAMRFYFTD